MPKIRRVQPRTAQRANIRDFGQLNREGEKAQARADQMLIDSMAGVVDKAAEYQKRKDNIDNNLAKADAISEAKNAAAKAHDAALTESEADGSDIVELYEGGVNEAKDSYLENVDEKHRALAEEAFDAESARGLPKVLGERRARHAKFVLDQSEETKKKFSSNTFAAPETAESNILTYSDYIQGQADQGLIRQDQAQDFIKQAKVDMANSAVDGMTLTDKRQFKQAIERVTTGDLAQFYSAEDRRKVINQIKARELQSYNQDIALESRERKRADDTRKTQKDETFRKLFGEAKLATDPVTERAFMKKVDAAVVSGVLDDADRKALVSYMGEDIPINDDLVHFNLSNRILSGNEQPEVLRSVVNRAVVDGTIKPSTGRQLLNQIESDQRSQSSDPFYKQKMRVVNNRYDAVYGSKEFLDLQGEKAQAKALEKVNAKQRHLELKLEDPTRDDLDIQNQVLREFSKNVRTLPPLRGATGDESSTLNGLNELSKKLKLQFRNGQLGKAEYLRRLESIQERKRLIELEEQNKPVAVPKKPEDRR